MDTLSGMQNRNAGGLNMDGNKYRNKKTTVDGVTFDSAKEARRYQELRLMTRAVTTASNV